MLLMPSGLGGWADVTALLIVFPIKVGLGSHAARSSLTPVLKFLSEVSYPFYLVHQHRAAIANFNDLNCYAWTLLLAPRDFRLLDFSAVISTNVCFPAALVGNGMLGGRMDARRVLDAGAINRVT